MVGFGALLGIQAGTSLLGGILGRNDAKKAQRRQEQMFQMALGRLDAGLGEARGYMDQQLDVARGIEESVLGSMDAAFASQVRNVLDQERQAKAQLESDLYGSGLDTTTLGPALRDQARRGSSRVMTDLAARFAVERGDQISRARGGVMNALGGRAQLEFGAGQAAAGLISGVQHQAPDTASAVGALGGSLVSTYLQGQQLDILRDALKAPVATGTPRV